MSPGARFDRWVESGPFTGAGLARYRVFFGLLGLVTVPNWHGAVTGLSNAFWNPPPGPFALLHGFPPGWVTLVLQAALAFSFACLVVGKLVRTASIAATLSAICGFGIYFSTGKVDHNIFHVLLPAVLCFAPWDGRSEIRQWPMRLLALIVGVGMATAGLAKATTSWLNPHTHAAQGHFLSNYIVNGRTELLAPFMTRVDSPWVWEPLDLVTVALELSVLIFVVSWRSFRTVIAALAIFHLSIYLIMNISFTDNDIVYAAFMPWERLRAPALFVWRVPDGWPRWAALFGLAGLGFWLSGLGVITAARCQVLAPVILFAGGLVGAVYLCLQVRDIVHGLKSRLSHR